MYVENQKFGKQKIKEYAAGLNKAYNSNFIFNLDDYWLVYE